MLHGWLVIDATNARELAAIGNKKRWDNWRAQKLAEEQALLNPPIQPEPMRLAEDELRRNRTLAQIDDLDKEYLDAPTELKIKLAATKEKLWRLVFPSPGSLRPKAPKSPRQSGNSPEPESA